MQPYKSYKKIKVLSKDSPIYSSKTCLKVSEHSFEKIPEDNPLKNQKKNLLQIEVNNKSSYERLETSDSREKLKKRFPQFLGTQYLSNPMKQHARLNTIRDKLKSLSPKVDRSQVEGVTVNGSIKEWKSKKRNHNADINQSI